MPQFILLDRDGVINRRIPNGYVTSWEQFEFLPRAVQALRLLAERDYKAIVVSNQAGVSKGLINLNTLAEVTRRFQKEVERNGGRIDGVYYCPHQDQDFCDCRKPKPGLLLRAQREHGFVMAQTYLVGDSEVDLMAAHQAGCPAILVAPGEGGKARAEGTPHCPRATAVDLYDAVQFILDDGRLPGLA